MNRMLAATVFLATAAAAEEVPLLWKSRCTGCHGRNGHGDTAMGDRAARIPHFDTADWQRQVSDERIRAAILRGVPGTQMRPMSEQPTDAEVEQLVSYLRTLGPAPKPEPAQPAEEPAPAPVKPQETLTVTPHVPRGVVTGPG